MQRIQNPRAADFILSLANGSRSLENGILAEETSGQAGTVLGQVLDAGAATAVGTATGNGVITVGAIGPAAQPGVYKLVCVAAAANAGTFNLLAPDGTLVRQVTVAGGVAANDHVTVTIADGAADFVVGDTFAIEVETGAYTPLDLTGDDGSQIATGLLRDGTDATESAKACVVVARDAEIKTAGVIWPAGISDAARAAAIAQLNARGIHLR